MSYPSFKKNSYNQCSWVSLIIPRTPNIARATLGAFVSVKLNKRMLKHWPRNPATQRFSIFYQVFIPENKKIKKFHAMINSQIQHFQLS